MSTDVISGSCDLTTILLVVVVVLADLLIKIMKQQF